MLLADTFCDCAHRLLNRICPSYCNPTGTRMMRGSSVNPPGACDRPTGLFLEWSKTYSALLSNNRDSRSSVVLLS